MKVIGYVLVASVAACGGAEVNVKEVVDPVRTYQPADATVASSDAAPADAGVEASADADAEASSGMTCRECGPDTWACAAECTAVAGFIRGCIGEECTGVPGDGAPYHCCTW